MDRLLQFVLVLTIATSSYSYVYRRPEMPVTPPKFELDDNYPTEYIKALVDALNPEELQMLSYIDMDLLLLSGRIPSSKCLSYRDTRSPYEASDEFGIRYYIIHSEKLPKIEIDAELCKYDNGYKCIMEEDSIRPTYADCCVNVMDLSIPRLMNVLAIPVKEFHSNTKLNGTIIQKDLYTRTRCACQSKRLTKHENNTDSVCLEYAFGKI